MANILFVVAHPDDEILGAGATIHKLCRGNHNVEVLIMTNICPTRGERDLISRCKEIYLKCGLPVTVVSPNYKCMSLSKQDHYGMVKEVENRIRSFRPDIVITHHCSDLNPDHVITSKVCQEAIRLPQRGIEGEIAYTIKGLYFIEVPSSTDWGLDVSLNKFQPNIFSEINIEDFQCKIKFLREYDKVIRDYPHPRSERGLLCQVIKNGLLSGYKLAEGLQTGFRKGIL